MAITTAEQIAEVEALLAILNTAITATITGGHSSYEIDTGQSNQGVKRLSLLQMRQMRKDLYLELDNLNAQLGLGRSTVTVIPGF